MSNSLPAMEAQRSIIQQQISQLGDMRRGSITTTGGRCGNTRCHCHEKDDPGHGPFYRLTRKVGGKTVTETFSTPAERRKAEREVAEYHRFRELSGSLVEVNEKICRSRSVEDTLTPQEKNGGSDPRRNRARSNDAVVPHLCRTETDRRDGSGSGGDGLPRLPASGWSGGSHSVAAVPRACCRTARHPVPLRPIRALPRTALATTSHSSGRSETIAPLVSVSACHSGQFPVDRQLDVENRDASPGVRRMQALVGQEAPFDHGREQMKVLAGVEVTTKSVERTAEAIGTDIATGEQREIRKAVQLDLPVIISKPIPILYVPEGHGHARPYPQGNDGSEHYMG